MAMTMLSVHSYAQFPTCSAQFSTNLSGTTTATFIPVSSGDSTVSHFWSFGDGTSSTVMNPVHTYNVCGVYNVLHLSRGFFNNVACSDTVMQSVVIACNTPCNLVSNFTFTQDSTNHLVAFMNTSSGFAAGDSIRWTFGDGTEGYDINPTHTYATAGTYTVCLWQRKNPTTPGTAPCIIQVCHTVTIAPQSVCNLVASFTQAATSATNTYTFTNHSLGYAAGDSIMWYFGDGTPVSYDANPTHTFAGAGTYTVCLKVKKPAVLGAPPCESQVCQAIVIAAPCSLNATFTATSTNQNNVYVFTNTSITANAPMISWIFGDSTTATGNMVTHTFSHPGTYTVCMLATVNNTCFSDTCITVTVAPAPCNLSTDFIWMHNNSSVSPISFISNLTGAAVGDSIRWDFGDSTISGLLNPTHTFPGPGMYNVCMRVSRPNVPGTVACVSEMCHTVVIGQDSTMPSIPVLVAFPNPVQNFVSVNVALSATASISAALYNTQNVLVSQQVVSGNSGNNIVTFNTQNLPAGYYTIRLYYNGQVSVSRFLKM